jgi:autotransporter-associated beta strand protein
VLEDRLSPATHIWTGFGATNLWSTAGNWLGGAPSPTESGPVILVFSSTAAGHFTNVDDIPGLNINQIKFNGLPSGYVLQGSPSGNTLALAGSGFTPPSIIDQAGGNTFDASLTLMLGGADEVNVAQGTLTIGSKLTGPGGFTKTGAGTLKLANGAVNDYADPTTVLAGVLQLDSSAPNGAIPGTLYVGTGTGPTASAQVQLGGPEQIADAALVTVNRDGKLALNNFPETIGALGVSGGLVDMGITGLTVTGLLAMAGGQIQGTPPAGLHLGAGVVTYAAAGTAVIGPAVGLEGVSQTFIVADNPPAVDLAVGALGGSSLTKAGPGTLELTGDNSFTGPIVVTAGQLIINGETRSSQGDGAVILTIGLLEGSGFLGPITATGGVFAPGAGPADFSSLPGVPPHPPTPGIMVSEDVSLGAATTFAVTLNGATAGSGYNQLRALGNVSLGNSVLDLVVGPNVPASGSFTIIQNAGTGTVSGTFAGLPEGAVFTAGGLQFQITYQGGSGHDVVVSIVPTPPPAPPPATTAVSLLPAEGPAAADFLRVLFDLFVLAEACRGNAQAFFLSVSAVQDLRAELAAFPQLQGVALAALVAGPSVHCNL